VSTRLPVLQGVLPLRGARVSSEIVAGVTLAALAIPEVMGYTKISGTPVITGLYTMLVPTALFACFGSSRHLVVGADSATAAILAAGLVGLAKPGSDHYTALAALLALMAAGFLVVARIVRFGFMADFLSRTVLVGFLTGVGIQVAIGQLPGMLGLPGGGQGTAGRLRADFEQLHQLNPYAVGLAVAVLAIVAGGKRISKRFPGALVAVTGAIAAGHAFDLGQHVHVVGAVPRGLPRIGLPELDWSWSLVQTLVPTAFAMFVVILAQSAATSRAYAARYGERVSANLDLLGLGLANIGAGLTGAFVVNGSPTKTQMVDSAGGRTQLSLLVTVLMVLAVLLFLTGPMSHMPEAALAAIVFLIGIDLVDLRGMRKIYRQRRSEFWVALITLLMVVFVGVEQGILLAIVLSLIDHTQHGYRPVNLVLVPGASGPWVAHPVASGVQAAPGLLVYRFTHSVYYANAEQLSEEILGLVARAEPPLRWLCIDASSIDDLDYTGAETLRALFEALKQKGVRLVVAQVLEHVREGSRDQLQELFGTDAFFQTLGDVVDAYRREAGATRDARERAVPAP
jgi:SulP family sulfate permease